MLAIAYDTMLDNLPAVTLLRLMDALQYVETEWDRLMPYLAHHLLFPILTRGRIPGALIMARILFHRPAESRGGR